MVSVIIPTYKNRGGLIQSIESVLSQNCKVEVIIVDDNIPESEERKQTESLMGRYASNPVVKYVKQGSHRNGSAARNTGVRASSGSVIAFLDDDDMFLPGKLEKQLLALEEDPNMDAIYCFRKKGENVLDEYYIDKEQVRTILMNKSNFQTSCLMFRREAFEKIGGFDESLSRFQDLDLMLRFFLQGLRLGCVQEVLVEVGKNLGENIPVGEKLDAMKEMFFMKYNSIIEEEECKTSGFANTVYSTHYAEDFLSHIKNLYFKRAFRAFHKSILRSPLVCFQVINNSIVLHLTGRA